MANVFWVNGSGTWNSISTANWSATTGGASGALPPTVGDTAIFDGNSGSGTCTTAVAAVCGATTLNATAITLKLSAGLNMAGVFALVAGVLDLDNQTLVCGRVTGSNSNVRSIAFGTSGKIEVTLNSATVWNTDTATNFTYTGLSNIRLTYSGSIGTRSFVHNALGSNGENIALNFYVVAGTDIISTLSGMRFYGTIDFTGFAGTLAIGSKTIYGNLVISNGMTLAPGTNPTIFAGTSGMQEITTNGKTIDFPLTFNGIGGIFAFQDALTQGTTRAFTMTSGTVELKANATSTVGSFVTSSANAKTLRSTSAGSQATLSQNSNTVNAQNLNAKDIAVVGGAVWNLVNGSINQGNVSGFYVAHQQNSYYAGGLF